MTATWRLLSLAASLFLVCTAVEAGVIVKWDFNGQNTSPSIGSGSISLVGTTGNYETDPTKVDPNDPGGASLEIAGWPTQTAPSGSNGIKWSVSTVGHTGIKVKWDVRHSIKNGETAPNSEMFQYSIDGGTTWVDGPTWTCYGDQWYLNRQVDLTGIIGVDNNPNFACRLMGVWQPGQGKYMPCQGSVYGNTRKWRLDLITVHDDPPPAMTNTIALWDFNDKGDMIADYGDGASFAQMIGGVGFDGDGYSKDYSGGSDQLTDSTSSSDPSLQGKGLDTTGYPGQSSGSDTAGMQFNVSTVGYSGIRVSFDLKVKMDSSRYTRVQYTTNRLASPVVWTNALPLFRHEITDLTQEAWWFNDNEVDLSNISAVNNNPNFAFRIVTEFDPDHPGQYTASRSDRTYNQDPVSGNKHRFDMVRVTASSALPASPERSIVDAKKLGEWQRVTLKGALISAIHPDYFWVQTDGGNCGIKVYAPQNNLNAGWNANIVGVTREGRDSEKYIYASSVSRFGTDVNDLRPRFLAESTLGGADWCYSSSTHAGQKGLPGSVGLSNTGLLVKIAGWVTAAVPEVDTPGNYELLYVDDGSGLYDGNFVGPGGTPANGVRVCLPKNFTGSYLGSFVQVTGVSSRDVLDSLTGTVVRCIRRPDITVVTSH